MVAVVIAVWAASNELGPFVEHTATDSALNLQLYITLAALTTLCLAAIVSERRRAALELAESRARIAAAGAEERRRLERELHDSAQNRLVGLQIRLGLAKERTQQTAPELAATFSRLIEEAEGVGGELRRIADGISPPLLATRGLVDALRDECLHSAIAVQLEAGDIGLSEPDVESAVYLSCSSGLLRASRTGCRPDPPVAPGRQESASLRDFGLDFETARLRVRCRCKCCANALPSAP